MLTINEISVRLGGRTIIDRTSYVDMPRDAHLEAGEAFESLAKQEQAA